MSDPAGDLLRRRAREVLEASWRPGDGFCPPNPTVYPHQWLWDSCFHAVAWAELGDPRGREELLAALSAQTASGFVPHMRYLSASGTRGPRRDRSSFTQPPIYAHAAARLAAAGLGLTRPEPARVGAGLEWLWRNRLDDGLLVVVHPWETGCDDSPRWDSWVRPGLPRLGWPGAGDGRYDKEAWRACDQAMVAATRFDSEQAAVSSGALVCAPASFNALAVHAADAYAELTGLPEWAERADALAARMDTVLWDSGQGSWCDRPVVGGGSSCRIPTLDGLLGALATRDPARAETALDQVLDPQRFAAPVGVRFLPPGHPQYQPEAYWRGPAWPQLNYLVAEAARKWGRSDVAAAVAAASRRGALSSGMAEYWNPETGSGLGAVPQGWAALAICC